MQGLLDPKAMARLALGEALTNLVWAKVGKYFIHNRVLNVFYVMLTKYLSFTGGDCIDYCRLESSVQAKSSM